MDDDDDDGGWYVWMLQSVVISIVDKQGLTQETMKNRNATGKILLQTVSSETFHLQLLLKNGIWFRRYIQQQDESSNQNSTVVQFSTTSYGGWRCFFRKNIEYSLIGTFTFVVPSLRHFHQKNHFFMQVIIKKGIGQK